MERDGVPTSVAGAITGAAAGKLAVPPFQRPRRLLARCQPAQWARMAAN
jgi:hypothetical protein